MFTVIRPDVNVDFMGFRKVALFLSIGVIVLGGIATVIRGGPEYGIDFAGGVELQVLFKSPVQADAIRSSVESAGVGGSSVQKFNEDEIPEYLIRVEQPGEGKEEEVVGKLSQSLSAAFGEGSFEIRRQEYVGPTVGAELRSMGIQAMLFSLVAILLYIALRFEVSFAVGAIAATLHDVVIVVLIFMVTGREFNIPIIAAVLTIIGYSLNDTVVVFDRIREMHGKRKSAPLEGTMNKAINQTLSRTILTSLVTLLSVLVLFFYTAVGSVIHDFAFAMICGIIVGTYSSIYIASPVVLVWSEARKKSKKR